MTYPVRPVGRQGAHDCEHKGRLVWRLSRKGADTSRHGLTSCRGVVRNVWRQRAPQIRPLHLFRQGMSDSREGHHLYWPTFASAPSSCLRSTDKKLSNPSASASQSGFGLRVSKDHGKGLLVVGVKFVHNFLDTIKEHLNGQKEQWWQSQAYTSGRPRKKRRKRARSCFPHAHLRSNMEEWFMKNVAIEWRCTHLLVSNKVH